MVEAAEVERACAAALRSLASRSFRGLLMLAAVVYSTAIMLGHRVTLKSSDDGMSVLADGRLRLSKVMTSDSLACVA